MTAENFRKLKSSSQIEVITSLPKHLQKKIFLQMMEGEQINLLERLDPNAATDILQQIDAKKRSSLLKKVDKDIQQEITSLLDFDADTAAGLMNLDYVQVTPDMTVKEVAEEVRVHERRTGRVPTILVLEGTQLIGEVPIYKLGLLNPKDRVGKVYKTIKKIRHGAKTEEVIHMFRNDPRGKVVVMREDKILGIIFSEDVLGYMGLQRSRSLYEFAGVRDEENVFDSARIKFQFRYKWLVINLGTAFLAALTVGMFESTIAKNVLLAVYMPVVAGMGGNAATQTLAVMVRGLALHELSWEDILQATKNEIIAGLFNGILNGVIVFLVVYLLNGDSLVGMVLACAMIINLIVSATFGTIVPYIMSKLGKDPASSATIFITTATDVFGFLAFLGLASVLLR